MINSNKTLNNSLLNVRERLKELESQQHKSKNEILQSRLIEQNNKMLKLSKTNIDLKETIDMICTHKDLLEDKIKLITEANEVDKIKISKLNDEKKTLLEDVKRTSKQNVDLSINLKTQLEEISELKVCLEKEQQQQSTEIIM